MTPQLTQIIVPAIVGVIGSLASYLIAKNANKKDFNIADRQLLSDDEKSFRQELRESITLYKAELEDARAEIRALRDEVAQLHRVNLELTLENKELQKKVDGLRSELQSFRGDHQ